MADKTGIEWTDATWNPVVGCSIVSPGCTNCYAMGMAARIERMSAPRATAGDGCGTHYAGTTRRVNDRPVWTGDVALAPAKILHQPLAWSRPRRIFVNSMGDLFHEAVPDDWIDQAFAVMALCRQHTFQVLTKRSARMQAYCSEARIRGRLARACVDLWIAKIADAPELESRGKWPVESIGNVDDPDDITLRSWPLPNVWLGVSAEDQRRADQRVPDLLATPAAVRFVSAEPLLGPLDFSVFPRRLSEHDEALSDLERVKAFWCDGLTGQRGVLLHDDRVLEAPGDIGPKLDWIIVGGESGPDARPMHFKWVEAVRDQCAAAGVPFFFKQWGEWINPGCVRRPGDVIMDGTIFRRVGKANAGRRLDGRTHDDMPGAPRA